MIARIKATAAVIAAWALLQGAEQAFAVDGEALINQAKVNAGGITAGDAAGFPATLSRSGHYKLSGTLSVPAGVDGIEVTADDVTIDLNGFAIRSETPGQAARGIIALSRTRLRVMNGTVTGFGNYAIVGDTNGVIENMRVLGSSGFSSISLNKGSRVRDSIIANGAGAGILCYGCVIERNIVTGNGDVGISAAGGQALDNVVAGNADVGIYDGAGATRTGYGGNILIGNGSGGQTLGQTYQIHPNVCDPACP